ncbi:surface-adhesin E family protein, partial [Polaromonas sp.]|uniref:surface-adhesin E family protein n=1 Tax=Polaromonas sp. TaxID=1869339 RepID=UPI002731D021
TMKRLLLALALSCLGMGAAAQWTPVMVDEMVITYIDRNTLRGKGGLVRMWWLMDYQLVQITDEKGYFSRLHHSEFDCKNQRLRLLSVALLSERMGHGQVVFEDPVPRRWEAVRDGSFQEALLDIACINY